MINVNSPSHIQSGIQVQEQYQHLNAVAQDVTAKPLQLQNDNVDLKKDRSSDKEDNHYSHNRHTALKAYLSLNSKAEAKTAETAQNAPQADERKDPAVKDPNAKTDETKDVKDPKEAEKKPGETKELTEEERQQVESMKRRDTEVRIHENAHKATGGHLASAPSYEYETGPDGKRYITGGHVNIDVSVEKDPKATIEKMQKVRAAAMAPAQPSSADRAVAADAQQKENEARAQLREQALEQTQSTQNTKDSDSSVSSKGEKSSDDTKKSDNSANADNKIVEPTVVSNKQLKGDMGV